MNKSYNAAVRAAGLVDVHPHDLRRTFGSWLVQAEVGIERVRNCCATVMWRLGPGFTPHLRPSDLADAVAVLDGPGDPVSRSSFTRADQPVQEAKIPAATD